MDNDIGKLYEESDESSVVWILVVKALMDATPSQFTRKQIIDLINKCKAKHKNSKSSFIKCVKKKLGIDLGLGGPKNT